MGPPPEPFIILSLAVLTLTATVVLGIAGITIYTAYKLGKKAIEKTDPEEIDLEQK